jgi:hypothetical protein
LKNIKGISDICRNNIYIAGKQDGHASDDSIAADEDNEFLLVDKVIRHALNLKGSTKKATNSAFTAQGTDKISPPNSSDSSMPAQSSLLGHLDGSKGTCIDSVPLQTKQLLNDAQSSQSYLMTMTMTIRTARAMPVENLVYLLMVLRVTLRSTRFSRSHSTRHFPLAILL